TPPPPVTSTYERATEPPQVEATSSYRAAGQSYTSPQFPVSIVTSSIDTTPADNLPIYFFVISLAGLALVAVHAFTRPTFAPLESRATPPSAVTSPEAFTTAPSPSIAPTPAVPVLPPRTAPFVRDTPAAIQALELANAYLEEVRAADRPGPEDKD